MECRKEIGKVSSFRKRNLLPISAVFAVLILIMIPTMIDSGSSSGGVTPNTCTTNQYATAITDTSGDLSCSQVAYTQLNNFPSSCSTNPQSAVYGVTTTLYCVRIKPIVQTISPATGFSTTSTSLVMVGLENYYTPSLAGTLLIAYNVILSSTVLAAQINIGLYYGTGTAPSSGSAVTGFSICNLQAAGFTATGIDATVAITCIDTGFGINTQYWFDLAVETTTSGATANVNDISMSIMEFA